MLKFFEDLSPAQKLGFLAAGSIAVFGVYKFLRKGKPGLFSLVLSV